MANQANVASEPYAAVRRVSWGAIFAGTVVAMVVQIVLTLLGLGIGLGVVNPTVGSLSNVGMGAAIWLGVSTLISLFIGGYFAGRLAGIPAKPDGALNGIVVWGLATLLSLYLATSVVGTAVSGVAGLLGQGFNVVTRSVTAVAPQAVKTVKKNPKQTKQALQQAAKETKQQFQQMRQQAKQVMDQGTQKKVKQTAKQVAPVAGTGALAGSIALLLGAIAAALGGMAGTPRDVHMTSRR